MSRIASTASFACKAAASSAIFALSVWMVTPSGVDFMGIPATVWLYMTCPLIALGLIAGLVASCSKKAGGSLRGACLVLPVCAGLAETVAYGQHLLMTPGAEDPLRFGLVAAFLAVSYAMVIVKLGASAPWVSSALISLLTLIGPILSLLIAMAVVALVALRFFLGLLATAIPKALL